MLEVQGDIVLGGISCHIPKTPSVARHSLFKQRSTAGPLVDVS